MPTMSWSVVIGMRPSAGPKIATNSARKIALAPAPSSDERQPRVVPTASTMVSASTHSTSEARNAATKAVLACSQVIWNESPKGVYRMKNVRLSCAQQERP
jgi:hypothetical protein